MKRTALIIVLLFATSAFTIANAPPAPSQITPEMTKEDLITLYGEDRLTIETADTLEFDFVPVLGHVSTVRVRFLNDELRRIRFQWHRLMPDYSALADAIKQDLPFELITLDRCGVEGYTLSEDAMDGTAYYNLWGERYDVRLDIAFPLYERLPSSVDQSGLLFELTRDITRAEMIQIIGEEYLLDSQGEQSHSGFMMFTDVPIYGYRAGINALYDFGVLQSILVSWSPSESDPKYLIDTIEEDLRMSVDYGGEGVTTSLVGADGASRDYLVRFSYDGMVALKVFNLP